MKRERAGKEETVFSSGNDVYTKNDARRNDKNRIRKKPLRFSGSVRTPARPPSLPQEPHLATARIATPGKSLPRLRPAAKLDRGAAHRHSLLANIAPHRWRTLRRGGGHKRPTSRGGDGGRAGAEEAAVGGREQRRQWRSSKCRNPASELQAATRPAGTLGPTSSEPLRPTRRAAPLRRDLAGELLQVAATLGPASSRPEHLVAVRMGKDVWHVGKKSGEREAVMESRFRHKWSREEILE
jgi:hypothetical protein